MRPADMVREEDLEETALAEVDHEFTEYFGPDWRRWKPWQVEQYLDAMAKTRREFSPEAVAA